MNRQQEACREQGGHSLNMKISFPIFCSEEAEITTEPLCDRTTEHAFRANPELPHTLTIRFFFSIKFSIAFQRRTLQHVLQIMALIFAVRAALKFAPQLAVPRFLAAALARRRALVVFAARTARSSLPSLFCSAPCWWRAVLAQEVTQSNVRRVMRLAVVVFLFSMGCADFF